MTTRDRAVQINQAIDLSRSRFPTAFTQIFRIDEQMCYQIGDENQTSQSRAMLVNAITNSLTECGILDQHGWALAQCGQEALQHVRGPSPSSHAEGASLEFQTLSSIAHSRRSLFELCSDSCSALMQEIATCVGRFAILASRYCEQAGATVPPQQLEPFAREPIDSVRGRLIAISGGRQEAIDRVFPILAIRHWDMMGATAAAEQLIAQLGNLKQNLEEHRISTVAALEELQGHLGAVASTAEQRQPVAESPGCCCIICTAICGGSEKEEEESCCCILLKLAALLCVIGVLTGGGVAIFG
jgi:hypothetical protein